MTGQLGRLEKVVQKALVEPSKEALVRQRKVPNGSFEET